MCKRSVLWLLCEWAGSFYVLLITILSLPNAIAIFGNCPGSSTSVFPEQKTLRADLNNIIPVFMYLRAFFLQPIWIWNFVKRKCASKESSQVPRSAFPLIFASLILRYLFALKRCFVAASGILKLSPIITVTSAMCLMQGSMWHSWRTNSCTDVLVVHCERRWNQYPSSWVSSKAVSGAEGCVMIWIVRAQDRSDVDLRGIVDDRRYWWDLRRLIGGFASMYSSANLSP